MSVDTSHVRPTSTLSPWQRVLFQQIADREIRNAALRAELASEPIRERTAADAFNDLQRYTQMLKIPAVAVSLPWKRDVERKQSQARAELGRLRRQAGAR